MGAQSHVAPQRKSYDPAAVYDPSARRRKSPTKTASLPTRFPDEDHAYEPLRRLRVAKLQQNALPPPSPSLSQVDGSPRTAQKNKKPQRIANIADSQLWGFSVKYSPSQELSNHWEHTKEEECTEVERLQIEQKDEEQRLEQDRVQVELSGHDYTLYLYLVSKYGPLDAILYCCTPYPGRLYALLIDQSVRKLQKWRCEWLMALRRYWIVRLAREVVDCSFEGGLAQIKLAMEHQRKAAIFLKRLRWRFAASAFRSWFEFTQRQAEVRWRFQFSVQENLRSRFVQWRERVAQVKAFKAQLKQFARRKRMQAAMEQWLEWQTRHQMLRVHLQQLWVKLQRECFVVWTMYARRSKARRRAATRIQSQWRASKQRAQYTRARRAASRITCLARGFLARRFVSKLRVHMEAAHALENILRTIEWESICLELQQRRDVAVEKELARADRFARYVAGEVTQEVERARNELDKVRKNATHQLLQAKVRWLQEEGGSEEHDVQRGPRTQEVLVQRATQMLLEETSQSARQCAEVEFLGQVDSLGAPCNLPAARELSCVMCSATTATLTEMSVPWLPAPPPCAHTQVICGIDAMDLDGLRYAYSKILEELTSRDTAFHLGIPLETTRLPAHELRKSIAPSHCFPP